MPPSNRFTPPGEFKAKVRWNRLARVSLTPELQSIGVFASSGTLVTRHDESDHSVNDAYYDESDRTASCKEDDVRISRITAVDVAELASALILWSKEVATRHVNIKSHDGSTYRLDFFAEEDLVSTLYNARLIDIVERPVEVSSSSRRIHSFLQGM